MRRKTGESRQMKAKGRQGSGCGGRERGGPCLMHTEFLFGGWKVLEIIVVMGQHWQCN